MRLTKKRADNGRYYLSGLAEVSNSYPKGYGRIQVGHAVDKLAEYEDLEEQNRLLKLPCAVGDMVYTNDSRDWWYLSKEDRPYEVKVDFIGITRAGNDNFINVVFTAGQMSQFKFSDIGKTVFLTREEAEAALEELEKE